MRIKISVGIIAFIEDRETQLWRLQFCTDEVLVNSYAVSTDLIRLCYNLERSKNGWCYKVRQ